jgi:hypothetical protein
VFRFGGVTSWHGAYTDESPAPIAAGVLDPYSGGYYLLNTHGGLYALGPAFDGAPG